MKPEELTKRYRQWRKDRENHRLVNTVSLTADILIRLVRGYYPPEWEKDAWEMVETLIEGYARGKAMKRVNKNNPCPICEKPDWCLYAENGELAICARISEGSVQRCGDAGYLHFIGPNTKPTGKPIRRYEPHLQRDFTETNASFEAAITDGQVTELSRSLGVSEKSLRRLHIGWDGEAFCFPMRNEKRKIIGIRRRFMDGRKFAVNGSTNALFIPDGLSSAGELFICEGPTDTAAGLDLGFDSIGRPNCDSRIDMTVQFAKGRKVTIIADRDKPGVDGAKKLARRLIKHCPEVMIMVPPLGAKDLREWVKKGFDDRSNNGF